MMNDAALSTYDGVVQELCTAVDYWKHRATTAEEALKTLQHASIKAAGLWPEYSQTMRSIGVDVDTPPVSTAPVP